uniref:trimethyllysine dioxygenase n=1 Tax=Aotus nancymaae TaxID=37293 RepID=A0A2K5D6Y8_AOTNA
MWCHRLSHLQSRLQDLLKGGVVRQARPQPTSKSLLPFAIRGHHTASKSLTCAWQQREDHFELKYANTVMRFDYVWLRDHCRSASCYNSKTHQRSLDTASVDLCIKPKTVRLDETTLFFTCEWAGDLVFFGGTLIKNNYFVENGLFLSKIAYSLCYFSFFLALEGFLGTFYFFLQIKLCSFTSSDRETIYGRMWYFTSDFSRGDTAYTKLALDRHTDTTYFQEPCGVQVFHCLKHEGTGGRTLLVDGFYAAHQVLQKAPEEFELLSNVPLKHEYIEAVGECHNHMIGVGPVLNIYPWNKELYLIRTLTYHHFISGTSIGRGERPM